MLNYSSILQFQLHNRTRTKVVQALQRMLVALCCISLLSRNYRLAVCSGLATTRARLAILTFAAWMVPGIASAQTIVVPGTVPEVLVDVKHCQWSSSLCSGSGSVGSAASGNASIVAIYYRGTTAGLTGANFTISSITNPGGVTPVFVSAATCAACFAEPQPGVYRLAARPAFGNWAGGTYVVLMTITRPAGASVSIVVPVDIPF